MTDNIWDRFESMLKVHAPALLASLRPPATEAQITAAEAKLGVQFPAEIRRAYLRHDGSKEGRFFPPFNWWACLEDLLSYWQMMVELYGDSRRELDNILFPAPDSSWDELKIAPVFWNEKWIPIGLSGTPTYVYLDLDPALKGTFGQIIYTHGTDGCEWVATGLEPYLELLIKNVESGNVSYNDGWEWIETSDYPRTFAELLSGELEKSNADYFYPRPGGSSRA